MPRLAFVYAAPFVHLRRSFVYVRSVPLPPPSSRRGRAYRRPCPRPRCRHLSAPRILCRSSTSICAFHHAVSRPRPSRHHHAAPMLAPCLTPAPYSTLRRLSRRFPRLCDVSVEPLPNDYIHSGPEVLSCISRPVLHPRSLSRYRSPRPPVPRTVDLIRVPAVPSSHAPQGPTCASQWQPHLGPVCPGCTLSGFVHVTPVQLIVTSRSSPTPSSGRPLCLLVVPVAPAIRPPGHSSFRVAPFPVSCHPATLVDAPEIRPAPCVHPCCHSCAPRPLITLFTRAVAPPTRTRDNHAHTTCPGPTPASSVLAHGPTGSGHARYVSTRTSVSTTPANQPTTHNRPADRDIQFPSDRDISNFRPTGPADTRSHRPTEDHHRRFGLGLTDAAHSLGDQADWGQSAFKVGRRCIVTCRLWAGIPHNSSFRHPSNHISGTSNSIMWQASVSGSGSYDSTGASPTGQLGPTSRSVHKHEGLFDPECLGVS